ncbi:Methionyl-tRNA synthetase [Fusarium oxysporum f. sp. albedinis]|nr:Methionyl-tRNA synthetase [Fusarium oxysporum f. sp. albedinis]
MCFSPIGGRAKVVVVGLDSCRQKQCGGEFVGWATDSSGSIFVLQLRNLPATFFHKEPSDGDGLLSAQNYNSLLPRPSRLRGPPSPPPPDFPTTVADIAPCSSKNHEIPMILRNQMKHTTKLLHAPTVSKQLILHNRFHPRLFPAMAASRGHRALPVIQFATDPQCRNQSNGIQIGIFMPGNGILPASLKNERETIATDLPSIDWVQAFMKRAAECELRLCGMGKYSLILEQTFRSRSNLFVSDGPVDFRYSQAAQIIHRYKPREAPSKMVDFCVFYSPEEGSEEEQAIEEICRTRPAQSINHTDLGDLCKRPIALSIETKRPNLALDNATLQFTHQSGLP